MYLTIPNEALELEALQEIYIYTNQNISEIGKIDFRKSNLILLNLYAFLESNICNDTFQNFAHLPLQVFDFMFTTTQEIHILWKKEYLHNYLM